MRRPRTLSPIVCAAALGLAAAACAGTSSTIGDTTTVPPTSTTAPPPATTPATALPTTAPPPDPVTVLAVADLADCRGPDAEVAALIDTLEGTVLTPGDLAYTDGSAEDFANCFLPLYADDLDRMLAVPGDNDYGTPGAAAFFDVFADRPGTAGEGWFSVQLGGWQVIGLNSNCDEVGGCGPESPQYKWLDGVLKAADTECRLVMWHMPRFTSSANYSGIGALGPLYGRLHGAGADVLLVGNSHHYERFEPLAPNGQPAAGGIANFTVGIGGAPHTEFGAILPGSAARTNEHRGVLRLVLRHDGYDWDFVNLPDADSRFDDRGSAGC